MSDGSAASDFHERMDARYRALPPRDSRDYLDHLREASVEELPAQVLVRAYREAAANGWEEPRKRTFERLVRETNGRFDHLGPLIRKMRSLMHPDEFERDRHDVLQETFVEMLRVLPTPRGEYAEKAWHRFAEQCLIEARRAQEGRRGERAGPKISEPVWTGGRWTDPVDEALAAGSSPNEPDVDVEALLTDVISRMADPLIRDVGADQWLSGDPSPISGKQRSAKGKPSLEVRLGVSRDRVVRAADAVLARIIAEMERRGVPGAWLDKYRKKPR